MFPLKQRTQDEGIEHHQGIPVRVYEGDQWQAHRIQKAREIIASLQPGSVVELGCGTADISGPFGGTGFDVCEAAIAEARRRFPEMDARIGIPEAPLPGDVLVLCEFLEHVAAPERLVAGWLPHFRYCLISHPLDEDKDSQLSGGEHQWSFSEGDFDNWFALGGHQLRHKETFAMGQYTCILGYGERL